MCLSATMMLISSINKKKIHKQEHSLQAVKMLMEGMDGSLWEIYNLWRWPQMTIGGTAVFVLDLFAFFFSFEDCCLL